MCSNSSHGRSSRGSSASLTTDMGRRTGDECGRAVVIDGCVLRTGWIDASSAKKDAKSGWRVAGGAPGCQSRSYRADGSLTINDECNDVVEILSLNSGWQCL